MSSYVVYKDKLKGEYLDLFERIEVYGISMLVDDDRFEEAMMSLVDVMCEAQEEGKPVTEIIGNDVETFCQEFFENPNYAKNWLFDVPNGVYRFSIIALVFFVLDILFPETETTNLMHITSNMGPAVVGFLFGTVFSVITGMFIRKIAPKKTIRLGTLTVAGIVIVFVCCVATLTLFKEWDIKVPAVVSCIICLCYILAYKMVVWRKRYRAHGSIRKTEEEKSRTIRGVFRETLRETMEEDMLDLDILKSFYKRYDRKNKRKTLSFADFDAILLKEQKFMKNESKYMGIFFIVLVVVMIAIVYRTSSPGDTLLFGVILTVIEFLIWKASANITKIGYEMRQKILNRAEEEHITVVELAMREEQKLDQ